MQKADVSCQKEKSWFFTQFPGFSQFSNPELTDESWSHVPFSKDPHATTESVYPNLSPKGPMAIFQSIEYQRVRSTQLFWGLLNTRSELMYFQETLNINMAS